MSIKDILDDMNPFREQSRREREEHADKSSLHTKKEIKDSKYYDEGQDGDYNSNSLTNRDDNVPVAARTEEGSEDYDDEPMQEDHSARTGSSPERKDESTSYIDYNGNTDDKSPLAD